MTDQMYVRRWQRDAHRALGEFLKGDDLPGVTWTIATSGALVADVDSLTSTPDEQRAAFAAWAGRLGASVRPERVDSGGVSHLYAQFAWGKNAQVRGAIRATIYPPFEDGDV
jgi:hypothetical protein